MTFPSQEVNLVGVKHGWDASEGKTAMLSSVSRCSRVMSTISEVSKLCIESAENEVQLSVQHLADSSVRSCRMPPKYIQLIQ